MGIGCNNLLTVTKISILSLAFYEFGYGKQFY